MFIGNIISGIFSKLYIQCNETKFIEINVE